ncbi:metal ABC transporter ATP-binding protein [uncultured Helcococcus sp.]|uniref:metal ABC transporter ATP-binding protein n=1 Tax=uncultured Helcococcus sp. TaxID=1072508 RepID=UPI0026315423|nr:metal ABC transporter ATP-binding protein [uncultured Helcococcus sp.]
MEIIKFKDLSFSYENDLVLSNINLTINKNDFVILMGNNGSGKSTLLKLLIGELTNFKGEIELFGQNIKEFSDWKRIGYVPQISRDNSTNFPISVKEMILLNLYQEFNFFNLPKPRHKRQVMDIIKSFKLEDLADRDFNTLSGGQKQRVMIAKAMVHNPEVLIFDEPTVGVDRESKEDFYDLINHLHIHHDLTIILVTHESDNLDKFNYKKYMLKEKELLENV